MVIDSYLHVCGTHRANAVQDEIVIADTMQCLTQLFLDGSRIQVW